MDAMRAREAVHDVHAWMEAFLEAVREFHKRNREPGPHGKKFRDVFGLNQELSDKFAILLDYDGTLSALESHPDLAVLPADTKRVLQRLHDLPNVKMAIISGRQIDDVMAKVGMEGIAYSGSHGNATRFADGTTEVSPFDRASIDAALKTLTAKIVRKFEGTWIEDKERDATNFTI
jgi:trehalose 6-phosphate synthase/phosphatase